MQIVVEIGGERLDKYLTKRVTCTRSQLKHAKILLNGKTVKSGVLLRVGDVIDFEIASGESTAMPERVNLDTVFEDDWLLVINKPRGMVVHPGAGVRHGTLLNALLGRGASLERAGIVHRLDKNTAGLLVVAKTAEVQAKLAAMFQKHEVRRAYIGLVEGVVAGEGKIDTQIVRDARRRTLFTTATSGGRKAVTRYKVLKNFSKWTLVQFELETGRTHQIRVHCKSIGHPIVGDPEYNLNSSIKGLSGQMLESVEVSFFHPITSKPMQFKLNPSKEFEIVKNFMCTR